MRFKILENDKKWLLLSSFCFDESLKLNLEDLDTLILEISNQTKKKFSEKKSRKIKSEEFF